MDSFSTPQAKFLRRIHQSACGWFSTVIGPEANEQQSASGSPNARLAQCANEWMKELNAMALAQ
jgi:hypothetical protein